jgi:hypothetical protein
MPWKLLKTQVMSDELEEADWDYSHYRKFYIEYDHNIE